MLIFVIQILGSQLSYKNTQTHTQARMLTHAYAHTHTEACDEGQTDRPNYDRNKVLFTICFPKTSPK